MLHPSYSDLMKVVNSEVEEGQDLVVNSRYSIVIATAKRARQIIAGEDAYALKKSHKKPLSLAVEELYDAKIRILPEDEAAEAELKETEAEQQVSEEENTKTEELEA